MNFATLKGLTVPEGNVTKIEDASGNVLWKNKPSTVTITLKGSSSYCGITHNGVYYSSATTFTANVGDVICVDSFGAEDATIYLNGALVASEPQEATYDYTVVSDATIELVSWGSGWESSSEVNITDENAP